MFPINSIIADALKVKRKRKADGRSSADSLSVDETVLQQLKAILKGNMDTHAQEQTQQQRLSEKKHLLEEVHRQLMLQATSSSSGVVRLKALQLLDFLVTRCPPFRTLACGTSPLRALLVGTVGLSFSSGINQPSSPPRDRQIEVRGTSLRMVEMWYVLCDDMNVCFLTATIIL